MLPKMRSILLIFGILLVCSAAGHDFTPRDDDQQLLQVTQDAGERRLEPQFGLLEPLAPPDRMIGDTGRENKEEHDNEIDLNGEENTWSIGEGDSTVWERGNTWSRDEVEEDLRLEGDLLWSRLEEEVQRDRETQEGSGQVDIQEEMQLDDEFDPQRPRQTLKVMKFDRADRQQRRMKEERRKRKRLQHQRKLKKTLQEEMKRRNKLLKIIMNAREGRIRPPNIIFIMADDLGYNDVPWHNPDIKAPELLRLARKGVVLENHYVLPLCAPSRAALLTGIYPFRYGKQASSTPLSPTGLNTSLTLLPERLKSLGYETHLVGKWHLGYCNTAYTPTSRGFDSFYGFYLGSQNYFTRFKKLSPKKGSPFWLQKNEVTDDHDPYRHPSPSLEDDLKRLGFGRERTTSEKQGRRSSQWQDWLTPDHLQQGGFDFRFNQEPLYNTTGVYSNELFAARAEDVIRGRGGPGSDREPLFLLLSLQAVHGPVEVPLKYKRRHKIIKNLNRRTFHGMVSALDEVVGRVVRQLKRSGLYDNSIIVFTTDNGGNIRSGGNNFPLRGSKGSLFEGGTRGVAFIHSPLLPRTGYKYTGLMHVVDWYETLLHAAQSNPSGLDENNLRQDALNDKDLPLWARLLATARGNEVGAEDSEVGAEDSEVGAEDSEVGADEDEKEEQEGDTDGMNLWSAIVKNRESPRTSFVYNVRKRPLRGAIRRRNWKLVVGSGGRYDGWVPPWDVAGSANTRCCSTWHTRTNPSDIVLYNLKDDPLETTDVSSLRPDVVANLKARLRNYALKSLHPHSPRDDLRGHPSLYGGFYSPGWCEAIV